MKTISRKPPKGSQVDAQMAVDPFEESRQMFRETAAAFEETDARLALCQPVLKEVS
jgi:hypothetical protein